MGWLFTGGQTRKDLIKRLTEREETETHIRSTEKHALRGNCLWAIMTVIKKETGETDRFIYLALIGNDGGYGWGYKEMTEHMGPNYYNCPLSFLNECPPPPPEDDKDGMAADWREGVREQAERNNVGRKLEVGATYKLQGVAAEWKDRTITIESLRPLRGSCGGMPTRFKKKMIGEKV